MSRERRFYSRTGVNWSGHITLSDGPRMAVRVLDFSPGGARLELAGGTPPRPEELLELTAQRRSLWPFGPAQPVHAMGRVVRVAPVGRDFRVELAVRFHTPLRSPPRRRRGGLRLNWALSPAGAACF